MLVPKFIKYFGVKLAVFFHIAKFVIKKYFYIIIIFKYLNANNNELAYNINQILQQPKSVNQNGLGGVMFWDYAGDTDKGDLRKALKKHLKVCYE